MSSRWLLYTEQAPSACLNFALCGLVGIIIAYIFVWINTYYTDYKHKPVCSLALSSSTGHGTNIIAGVSLGLESTTIPILVISVSIALAYWLGQNSGLVDESRSPNGGFFGTAVAAMGMLKTGALGGKGSDTHKAAFGGDILGDPFKDTSEPSLHPEVHEILNAKKYIETELSEAKGVTLIKLQSLEILGWCNIRKLADVGADLVGKLEKGIPEDDPWNPVVITDLLIVCYIGGGRQCGLLCCTRSTRDSSMKATYRRFNGKISKRLLCYNNTAVLTFGVSTRCLLYTEQAPSAWLNFALGGLFGHGTNITSGVSLDLESAALSVSVKPQNWWMNLVALTGLFGMAIAKMGMLSTTAYVLTMDMFGPIAYNAGGMVEMSQQSTAKGFAMGSVVLASFLLFSAYMDEVTTFAQEPFKQVDIVIRKVWIIGKEDYLLREYKERPDYGRCVVIIASAYLRAIIKPGALDHIINTGCCNHLRYCGRHMQRHIFL
ncbi:hypothetical protein ACOSQ2_021685 [Xanthoceras sorbifolium]